MTTTPGAGRRFRSALLVDFDNVYIGLRRLDPAAADAFANDPAHWLGELESGQDKEGDFERRFLIRACYLNPSVFSRFRPNFTRAGFQVVDCPSLTQQGKSSADINLVLDAVDALNAATYYDEFVIVSADADFTPLALRCRAADRRVTIITASPAASAYRAVADVVITADDLAELVTSGTTVPESPATEAAAPPPPRSAPVQHTVPPETATTSPAAQSGGGRGSSSPARKAVVQRVRSADRPVPLGAVATSAQKADPDLMNGNWAGTGSFLAWITKNVPEVGVSSRPPGYVWDPKRFGEADLPGAVAEVDPNSLQRQVVAVTDTPGLSAAQYRTVLMALATDVTVTPFNRAETSKRVREAARAGGALVGRSTVNFMISGVLYGGVSLQGPTTPEQCAEAWADNVIGLCRGARMELTEPDVAAIRDWVGGGLIEE